MIQVTETIWYEKEKKKKLKKLYITKDGDRYRKRQLIWIFERTNSAQRYNKEKFLKHRISKEEEWLDAVEMYLQKVEMKFKKVENWHYQYHSLEGVLSNCGPTEVFWETKVWPYQKVERGKLVSFVAIISHIT